MLRQRVGEKAVELCGRHARVPRPIRREHRRQQAVEAFAGERRDGDERRAGNLRQEVVEMGAKPFDRPLFLLKLVPFVDRENDGAALAGDEIGDRQILLLERCSRVDDNQHAFGKADGVERDVNRQLFEFVTRGSRALAQARRVVDDDRAVARLPDCRDRVAGDAGLGAGQ